MDSRAGAAAWLGARGGDVGALEGIVLLRLYVAPVMILQELGDVVGLVDFVLPGMISQG